MPMQAPSRRHTLIGGFALLIGLDARGGLIEVIVTAKRCVGAVGTFGALDNPRFGFRGTGFVVGDGNSLITNAHVLPQAVGEERASTLAVQFISASGAIDLRSATVARADPSHDLVLLRFEGAAVPALRIAEEKDIHEGLAVAFIGFPIGGVLGFKPVTHHGIISSITAVALPAANSQQLNERTLRRLR